MKISPVPRPRLAARAAYDRLSPWYDALAGSSEHPFARRLIASLNTQPGQRILDIGCGTGYALEQLAKKHGDACAIYGFDLSSGMLVRAKKRLSGITPQTPPKLVCGDGLYLPFGNTVFDAILMNFTLELFDTPDIPHILAESKRILKPGGKLGIVSLSNCQPDKIPTRLYEWAHAKFPHAVDCRPIPAAELIEQAGFDISSSTVKLMWGLPVETVVAEI